MTIAAPLFLIASDPTLFHSLQAHAQINNTDNIISSNITSDMANKVISEQSVILSGIISSEDFNNVALKTGEDSHGAAIRPNRDDGTIYTGRVTFITTNQWEWVLAIGYILTITLFLRLMQIDLEHWIQDIIMIQENAETPGDLGTPSVIVPDYSTALLYFFASIPFIGDSVWLRTVPVNLLSQ